MAFSQRVGMEPATDLKNRVSSLCQEAGFIVGKSLMHLIRKENLGASFRIIIASVREPSWDPTVLEGFDDGRWKDIKDEQIEVRAFIGCDGTYSGTVELKCMATDKIGEVYCPTLRNCVIALDDLPRWLPDIASQMHEVIASRKSGDKGPWRFKDGEVVWETFH